MLEDFKQVTMYKWEWITEAEALLQSVFIERKLLYLLGLPRKWEQQPWIFNKQGSLTKVARKLNLVTTACNIYDSQLGCDAVSNIGSVAPYVLKDLCIVGNNSPNDTASHPKKDL